ncbi:MAG TPA: adenylate/guanylate cyclase domain-containing protein [Candidatus Nanopelagicales bacterium]|nr:adenylate/guanylate cyclase domain-containing protein [Candidatus Nanopelagicales bacterium]
MTSVLFGDLVGFTPLSESKDSEEVRELLSEYFQRCRVIVSRYGGVIEKFIGDAVMAVWGVPVAHEDDAERAVRAGIELVGMVSALGDEAGVRGLRQRVGIVTGEVAVSVGATAEGMVAGDSVNTASRVQSVAEPGQVWVDEATKALASAAISFEDVGSHTLKGKAEPQRLWRAGVVVDAVGGGQRVDGLEAPFTGRDADVRLLKDLFHATQEAGRPRLVVLDGEAGVGKSRLAWEFEKYVDGLTATTMWHRGRCLSYGDGVAFWALAEIMRTRLGLVEADTGDAVNRGLDDGLLLYVADAAEREWLRPRLALLLGVDGGGGFPREELFAAWTTFLERLVSDEATAVVLVIDDAQHADDGLLDFIDHLLATAHAAIFVLALARPELLARRPSLGGRKATIVRLEPLDDAAMAVLVDGLVADLPVATRSALVERAEGIPLFAVETVRALIDRDLVVPREGRYVPAGAEVDLDAIGAPATLQALVAARLDLLDPEERRVVADASVLGLTVSREALLALGTPPQRLDELLDSLRRREILTLQTDQFTAERGQYRFVQSVVRQVAYSTQSRRDRKTRHLAAADHLAQQTDGADDLAVVIAQHLLAALDATPPDSAEREDLSARARHHLELAAARATEVGAPGEALRLYTTALEHTHEPESRAGLHLASATVAITAGDYAAGAAHATTATEAYDALGQALPAGRAAAEHARALSYLGDNAGAIEVASPRWEGLQGIADAEPVLLTLAESLSRAANRQGDRDARDRYTRELLLLAEALGDPEALATAQIEMGIAYASIGAPATARASYETAVEIARQHGVPTALARALATLGGMLNSREVGVALTRSTEATEVARRAGLRTQLDLATGNLIIGSWIAGHRLDGLRGRLAEAFESTSTPGMLTLQVAMGVWVAEAMGEPLDEVADEPDSSPTDEAQTRSWRNIVRVVRDLDAGDAAAAAQLAESTIDHMIADMGIEDDFLVLWPWLVQAALAAGDVTLAERLLQPVDESLPGRVSAGVAAMSHRLRALVGAARGDAPDDVERSFRAGIAALEEFGAPGYRARTQHELAEWLLHQGRTDDAAPLLAAARSTYEDMAATGWMAAVDARNPSPA